MASWSWHALTIKKVCLHSWNRPWDTSLRHSKFKRTSNSDNLFKRIVYFAYCCISLRKGLSTAWVAALFFIMIKKEWNYINMLWALPIWLMASNWSSQAKPQNWHLPGFWTWGGEEEVVAGLGRVLGDLGRVLGGGWGVIGKGQSIVEGEGETLASSRGGV